MEDRDLDSLRQKPEFKHIVRAVLKHQMKYLVEQLSRYGEEEVMVLATSLQGGVVSHLGSPATDGFLENREDIKSQFLGHCRRKSFIERPESAVHRSENSSLQDVQTAIPQTHQYITAGSTLICAVQPGIAVDSSPTFTSTLSSIGTQSVDMNMHPNTVNTQPNSNLHYPQSLSWQTTQVAPHNQSKAPMTGVTRTVKPTKSGVKRPCETVTSDKCSSIKTVRVSSSDIRDKYTALPTIIECTTEHTDAKKRDDDKSVEHLENSTEMQAVNDDSIFDDYVLGQFDGVEKSTDAPDTSNDQVSDDSSQIHQLTSGMVVNCYRTPELLIDSGKEFTEVNAIEVPMDQDLCCKRIKHHGYSRTVKESDILNIKLDDDLNRINVGLSSGNDPLNQAEQNIQNQNIAEHRDSNQILDVKSVQGGTNSLVVIKSEEKDAEVEIGEFVQGVRKDDVNIDLCTIKTEYVPEKDLTIASRTEIVSDMRQEGKIDQEGVKISNTAGNDKENAAEKDNGHVGLNETTLATGKHNTNLEGNMNENNISDDTDNSSLTTQTNTTESVRESTIEGARQKSGKSDSIEVAPEFYLVGNVVVGNSKPVSNDTQQQNANNTAREAARPDDQEIACQSKAETTADQSKSTGVRRKQIVKSYPIAFKLDVIKYAEENGNFKAERHFKLSKTTVRNFRMQKKSIEALVKEAGEVLIRMRQEEPQWPELKESHNNTQTQIANSSAEVNTRPEEREVSCQSQTKSTADDIEHEGDKINQKSYVLTFILDVVKYAEENGNHSAEKQYKIKESTIRGWREKKKNIQALAALNMKEMADHPLKGVHQKSKSVEKETPSSIEKVSKDFVKKERKENENDLESTEHLHGAAHISKEISVRQSIEVNIPKNTSEELEEQVSSKETSETGIMENNPTEGISESVPGKEEKQTPHHLRRKICTRSDSVAVDSQITTAYDSDTEGLHFKRKAYSCSFKLEVVKFAEEKGNAEAVDHYKVHEATIRGWRRKKKEIEAHTTAYDSDTEASHFKRKPFSCSFKLEVVKFAEEKGNAEAVDHYKVHDSTIWGWRRKKKEIEARTTANDSDTEGFHFKRKAYSCSFKLEVVKFAEEKGNAEAVDQYKVHEATIRGWIRKKKEIEAQSQSKMQQKRMKTSQWPELEKKVLASLQKQESEGKMVAKSVFSVKKIAIEIAKEMGITDFNASSGWVQRFKLRHGLYDT